MQNCYLENLIQILNKTKLHRDNNCKIETYKLLAIALVAAYSFAWDYYRCTFHAPVHTSSHDKK